jgi:hypothetical protein
MTPKLGNWKLDIRYWTLNIGYWILKIEHWILNIARRTSNLGHRPLNVERWMLNVAGCLLLLLPLPARAQLGPYPIVTQHATFEAELVKRDANTLWVRRKSSDGRNMPQVGIAVADVETVRMPRPGLFDAVERLRASPNATDAHFRSAHAALDKFILQTRSFRGIPGIPADDAILLKGRLHDRQGQTREAIRQYENVVANAPASALATNAQILAGIAYSKVGEPNFAIEYLVDKPLQEDDEEILSAQLFALGDSYLALQNVDRALMAYLSLVVFYPYVADNESRALAAALPCYAALEEWEPFLRTVQDIQATYPNSPAAKTAADLAAKYKDELAAAGQFVDPPPAAAPPAASASPADSDIEYPDDL